MNKQIINELDISKIGDERHIRPNFKIDLIKINNEEDRAKRFQKIKNAAEKRGWRIIHTTPTAYAETMIISGPKSTKETAEGLGINVRQISVAFTPSQAQMMSASKDVQNIANIITEDPDVIKESRYRSPAHKGSGSGWSYHIPLTYDGLDLSNLGFGKFDIEYVVGADWNKEERRTLEYPGSPAYWEWGIVDIEQIDAHNIENFKGVEGIAHPPGLRPQAVGSEISLGHNESPAPTPEDHFDDTEDEYYGDPIMIMGRQLIPDTKQKFIDALEEKLTDSETQEELSNWAYESGAYDERE